MTTHNAFGLSAGTIRNKYGLADGVSGDNEYLGSILEPFDRIASVPDLNMTTSIQKSVSITDNTTVSQASGLLYMFTPHSPSHLIRVYAANPTGGLYSFLRNINPDQDLSLDYKRGRYVSAGLKVVSATTSSGIFSVQGTFNAIAFQDTPPITQLTFETLLQYRRDELAMAGQIPVQRGICAIGVPDDDHDYQIWETQNTFSEKDVFVSNVIESDPPFASTGPIAFAPAGGTDTTIFDTLNTDFIPPNAYGFIKLQCRIRVRSTFGGAVDADHYIRGRLRVRTTAANPTTYVPATTDTSYDEEVHVGSQTGSTSRDVSIYIERLVRYDADVTRIFVDLRGYGDAASTWTFDPAAVDASFTAKFYSIYRHGVQDPGFLIAVKGVEPTSQIAITGKINYEVVPDYRLATNIKTGYTAKENTDDMQVAELVLRNADQFGIRSVYIADEYVAMSTSGYFRDITTRRMSYAMASGFSKFLRTLVKTAAPAVGMGIGALLGNPAMGGMIGQSVSGMLAGKSGYAAGEMSREQMQQMIERLTAEVREMKELRAPIRVDQPMPENIYKDISTLRMNGFGSLANVQNKDVKLRSSGVVDATAGARKAALSVGKLVDWMQQEVYAHTVQVPVYVGKDGTAYLVSLVWTSEPVSVAGLQPNYEPMDQNLFVDSRFGPIAKQTIRNLVFNLPNIFRERKMYLMFYSNVISALDGPSLGAAMVVLLRGYPAPAPITGVVEGPGQTPGNLEHVVDKARAVIAAGKRLIVYGMQPGLDAIPDVAVSDTAVEMGWASSFSVIVVDSFLGLQSVGFQLTYHAPGPAEEPKPTTSEDKIQKIMIGNKEVKLDFNDLDSIFTKYDFKKALAEIAASGGMNKTLIEFKDLIRASVDRGQYGNAARRLGQVIAKSLSSTKGKGMKRSSRPAVEGF